MIAPAVTASFPINAIDDDLGPYIFLREHTSRNHHHVVRRQFKQAVPRSVLPERAIVLHTIHDGECFDIIADIDGVMVLLRAWTSAGDIWASADDPALAESVIDEARLRVPVEFNETRVDVRFTDAATGDRYRKLDVKPWAELREWYPHTVRQALDSLAARQSAGTGRILLWHGQPGTGKTTAIRALLHAWRNWAEGTIVTDAHALLNDGRYLRRTVLREDDDNDRWQLVILEDAEGVLRKSNSSNALTKLLNLGDGLLGQGLRCLFLITTNERITDMHPALLRPGRCLANIEFTKLTAAEATAATGQLVREPHTLGELLTAYPITAVEMPVATGQYL